MKKVYCIFLFFVFTIYSSAQSGKEIFMENYCSIEDILNGKLFELNTVFNARNFLIELTGITYEMERPFLEPIILPPNVTMQAWKKWFEENESKLYWDKNRKKVIVRME